MELDYLRIDTEKDTDYPYDYLIYEPFEKIKEVK
jgi:hypothetical protein